MGLSCPLGIVRVGPAKVKFSWRNVLAILNKSFIDQACSVKMAGYWPRSFLRFYGPRLRLGLRRFYYNNTTTTKIFFLL